MKIPNPFSKPATQSNLTSGSDGTVVSQTSQSNTVVQSHPKVDKQIETLVPGQTLQGEVVAKNGNEITLKVAGDMLITARLERELNLELGKLLTFQVKNNGKMLSLSPLFANMAMESTAGKALDMANIPITDRTLQMAGQMMEKGMPVDINNIQNVYKDVAMFGNATVEHIIRLHQMNVPVTAETISQLINYENLEHQLSMGLSQVVSDLQAEGLAQPLLGQVLAPMDANVKVNSGALNMVLDTQELLDLANVLKQSLQFTEAETHIHAFVSQPLDFPLTVREMLTFLSHIPMVEMNDDTLNVVINQPDDLADLSVSGNQNLSGSIATNPEISLQMETLLNGPIVNKLLSAHLGDQWTLLPEQVSDKKQVLDSYERLSKQLEGLKQALESTKSDQGNAWKSVNTLQNNIHFMHHLNQMYNYIQIPLTLNGKHTQGELYVYSNKRSLAKEDAAVSALLHLDMEHLGPVDVYVTMQNQKVNTNFYLETDELLDFIHEHIYILDEHLAKRGYSLTAKMMVREETDGKKGMNVIEQIMREEPDKMVLSQYAFDVRA